MKDKIITSALGFLLAAGGVFLIVLLFQHAGGISGSRIMRNLFMLCIAAVVVGVIMIFVPWITQKGARGRIQQVKLIGLDEKVNETAEICTLKASDISKIESIFRKDEDYSVSLLEDDFEYADFLIKVITDIGEQEIYPEKNRTDIVMCQNMIGYGKELTEEEGRCLKEVVNYYHKW